MSNVETLRGIIQAVVARHPSFFRTSGAGLGNRDSNAFVKEVRAEAEKALGPNCIERKLCGASGMAVDYYFENEKTIVELARLVKNPNSEFHQDILKALLAKEHFPVDRLVFFGKKGAKAICEQPARKAIIDWAYARHGLCIEVYDVEDVSEAALSGEDALG